MIGEGAPRPGHGERWRCRRAGCTTSKLNWLRLSTLSLALGCVQYRIRGCPQTALRSKIKEKEGAAARGVCGAGLDSRPGGHQKVNKLARTIVGSVVVALALMGCGASKQAALPTKSVRPTLTPTPSAPAWTNDFTSAQVAQINRAIGVVDASRLAVARLRVDDAAARAVFREFYATPSVPEAQLKQAITYRIKTTGTPIIVWTRPVRFDSFGGGKDNVLTVDQCVDNSKVKTTVGGKPANYAYNSRRQVAEWVLYETGRGWLIGASGSKSSC